MYGYLFSWVVDIRIRMKVYFTSQQNGSGNTFNKQLFVGRKIRIIASYVNMESIYAIPYYVLECPNLKLKRPSWVHMPSGMVVFSVVLASYFLVTGGTRIYFIEVMHLTYPRPTHIATVKVWVFEQNWL